MRNVTAVLMMGIALCALGTDVLAADTLTKEERVFGLVTVYRTAKQHFAWFEQVPDLDWDRAFTDWLPLVEEQQSLYDYYRTLQRFAALLQDGHTSVYLPPEVLASRDNLPFLIDFVESEYVVSERMPSEEILREDLPPGSVVLSIEGCAPVEWLRTHVFPYVANPGLHSKRLAFNSMRWFPKGAEVQFEFRYPDGSTHSRAVAATRSSIQWDEDLRARYLLPWHRPPSFKAEHMDVDTTYVRYGACTPVVEREFCEFAEKLGESEAQTMILDVRGNRGGDTPEDSIGHLISEPLVGILVFRTRCAISCVDANLGLLRQRGVTEDKISELINDAVKRGDLPRGYSPGWLEPEASLEPSGHSFRGKLLILTNRETGSAAEEFVAFLQASGRATVIGETTAGSAGTPILFDLPGGGKVRVCTLSVRYPDGETYVDAGIEPDIPVERTINAIADGRDEVLEAALHYLHSGKQ